MACVRQGGCWYFCKKHMQKSDVVDSENKIERELPRFILSPGYEVLTSLRISQTFPINHKCINSVQMSDEVIWPSLGMEICRFPSKIVAKQHYMSNEGYFPVTAKNQMLCMLWLKACLPKTYNEWANMWGNRITFHIPSGIHVAM